MPKAIITSRQLKNKDTGLDLSVPGYREVKGRLQSTIYYQVVLVSNLACFKAPSHKESDVVQYSIEKKWNDFEELIKKVSLEFSGTVIPPINKKSIIVNDLVLRERRNSLDQLVKFMASVSKMVTCTPLLEFLGVDAIRAKKFSRGETLEPSSSAQATEQTVEDEATDDTVEFVDEEEEAKEDEDDFFADEKESEDDGEMFGSDKVQMFDRQDLKRELTEEDEKDFGFIPDAIVTKKTVRVLDEEDEDKESSDLFKIEDDLDELMLFDVKKKDQKAGASSQTSTIQEEATTSTEQKSKASKPTVPSKPKPALKPKIAEKPKGNSQPDTERPIPAVRQLSSDKPKPAPRSRPSQSSTSESASVEDDATTTENLDQDDIMKYLQDNLASNEEEVDLFS